MYCADIHVRDAVNLTHCLATANRPDKWRCCLQTCDGKTNQASFGPPFRTPTNRPAPPRSTYPDRLLT